MNKIGEISIGEISIGEISIGNISLNKDDGRDEFMAIPDLTEQCKKDIGEQLQAIKKFEQKFKDRWDFESDARYYFSICFKSGKERDAFLKKHKIKLRCDDHVFYEEIKDHFKED